MSEPSHTVSVSCILTTLLESPSRFGLRLLTASVNARNSYCPLIEKQDIVRYANDNEQSCICSKDTTYAGSVGTRISPICWNPC